MAVTALVCFGIYMLLAFGLRTAMQLRQTGASGFKGVSGKPGSVEWIAGVGFVIALIIGFAAPALALLDLVEPIDALDTEGVHAAGLGLFAGGLVSTVMAQAAMGDSWRIGVDEAERTVLVTDGPFSIVRNPIFAGMIPASLGLALMVPSWVALIGAAALWLALELQVRVVEEPYLLRAQGPAYAEYAARTGRFLPGVGRLRPAHDDR
ncbi:MAG: isoprenylcysteine carboxylmethyltransferase family protein [Thermoleophilaceae bacterium]|nr:isoprenylcysteine carboxylmethyltransferase family protein [Thermoleophilaceae bacterium]